MLEPSELELLGLFELVGDIFVSLELVESPAIQELGVLCG